MSRRTRSPWRAAAALLCCSTVGSLAPAAAAAAPPPAVRTGVLVHGYHLQAPAWERVVWGDAKTGELGRVPHGVDLALKERATLCVFGTGGSEADDGTLEGPYTLSYLRQNLHRLLLFERFADADLEALSARLETVAVADDASTNTVEELEAARALFEAAGIDRVILVSSPTHLPRCLRDASVVFRKPGSSYRPVLLASPCDTPFLNTCAADVAVAEPPHRGDRDPATDPKPPFCELANRMLRLPAHQRPAFARRVDALLVENEEAAGQ